MLYEKHKNQGHTLSLYRIIIQELSQFMTELEFRVKNPEYTIHGFSKEELSKLYSSVQQEINDQFAMNKKSFSLINLTEGTIELTANTTILASFFM
jgi:hypothetical protein